MKRREKTGEEAVRSFSKFAENKYYIPWIKTVLENRKTYESYESPTVCGEMLWD